MARDGEYICFIEVKYRSSDSHGSPAEAVSDLKIEKLQELARFYISSKNLNNTDIRFDVVSVMRDRISLIKNAFGI